MPRQRQLFFCLVIILAGLSLSGCSGKKTDPSLAAASASTNSVAAETLAAGDFLRALHEQGKLPGDSRETHGQVTTDELPLAEFDALKYPFSRTFHVAKTGVSATNHYSIVRQLSNSDWELRRAWRTDSAGKTIEEFPVK